MTTVYGLVFAVALIMTGVYFFIDRKRNIWLMLLFVSVDVCNLGYFLLSASKTLDAALWANRLAYLGCVFLPFSMLMMIINLSGSKCPKLVPGILTGVNIAMFLVTSSGGLFPIYYKAATLDFIDGAAVLVKEYGPLHVLYKVFLFSYFAAMIAVIIRAAVKRTAGSVKHTVFLAFIVLGSIAMWLVENTLGIKFEFLSISHIITEGLILMLYGILQDFDLADKKIISDLAADLPEVIKEPDFSTVRAFKKEQIELILSEFEALNVLSQREKEVLAFLLENKKRKDIAETLFVTESTIKKHTSAIYKKLDITCRAELFEKSAEYLSKHTVCQ